MAVNYTKRTYIARPSKIYPKIFCLKKYHLATLNKAMSSYYLQSKGKKRQVGWFPASYVKLMDAAAEKGQPAPTAQPAEKFRALFAYAGQHEDELSFQVTKQGPMLSMVADLGDSFCQLSV
jgi:hypothetical protein